MWRLRFCVVLGGALGLGGPVLAQSVADGIPQPSIATSLPQNGDPYGIRKRLGELGVVYNFIYTNDTLSNVSGGQRRGTINQGKLETTVAIDFAKLAGWVGLEFFANSFQIHNTGRMRRDYVGGVNTVAAIEAVPTSRLSELWFEQKILDGRVGIRFGQLAADAEFFSSDLSALFLQSDWPTIAALNLPSGGAAYPLSTPGVRFKFDPTAQVSLLFAVLNGDPAGSGSGDEQLRNRYGLNFRVSDPAFVIGEVQFRRNRGKDNTGLAGTLKLGGWAHLGWFDDQRFSANGTLLADPAATIAIKHRGNFGLYGVIEQQLYRPAGGGPDSGISLFGRVSASPSDRNPVDFYLDGGVVFAGLVPGRPNDSFGASLIYARFSDALRAFDQDRVVLSGIQQPIRDFEANLELTYQAEIIRGWTVQPNFQYIWHPNGDASRNAMVVGVRSLWRY